jgi:hypothetical protein
MGHWPCGSVVISSSTVFARGLATSYVSLLMLLAKAGLGRDFSRGRGQAGPRYTAMPGVVGIAVGVISHGICGRVGGI